MSQKLYTIHTALWESDEYGKNDITIDGITNHSFSVGSDVQTWFSDGDVYSQFGWMENVANSLQLDFSNYSLLCGTHSLDIGDLGVLTLKFPQRSAGQAGKAGGATALKAVCGNDGSTQDDGCMITAHRPAAAQAGPGSGSVEFSLQSVDGATSPTQISLAAV